MSRKDEMNHSAISPEQVTLVRRNIGHGDNRLLRHTGRYAFWPRTDHDRLAAFRHTMHG
jgi:hypothetical protein